MTDLQYADNTLFFGETSIRSLWSLKTILGYFRLASGLKVNFSKSSVMSVNVSDEFLGLSENFSHSRWILVVS